ncbi:hypothetical protein TNMX_09625 [Thermus sp. NMX2.A1]|jgi:exodeoxyribonuclease VII large subunit|nr:hypothetical protein TNMX_09625 [Thermus sp. NMX2.A1]
MTPGQLLQGLHALFAGEVFRRLKDDGPYLVRGVFADRSNKTWGGFYYGDLRNESGGPTIRLKVPLGVPLEEARIYTLSVTPELSMNGDMPRMVFRVEALQEEGDLTQAREVRLPKRTIPKRDVRALLLELLRKGEMPSIVLVVGETAIVDKDVEALLQGARGRYRMDQKRVNLLDPWGVAKVLKDLGQSEYHLVALVRGGGEGLEALDSPEVWEAVATCPKPVVVALGHAANTLWVETLADEAFPTPSAFGSFLGEVVKMVEREMREAKEKATLADLLHKAQDENRALRQEADRLKEQLRKLEGEPGVLFQEVARLRQALGVWRAVALGALLLTALLLLSRLL